MIERRSKKDTTGIIRPDPQTSITKGHQFPSLSESLPHPRPLVNSVILEKLNDLLKKMMMMAEICLTDGTISISKRIESFLQI